MNTRIRYAKSALPVCLSALALTMMSSAEAGETSIGDVSTNSFGELDVGNGSFGSYIVNEGTVVQKNGINVGFNSSGTGQVAIAGSGTMVSLVGSTNRLVVGAQGAGQMMIVDGAVVEGSGEAASCSPAECNFFVGNSAGSSGSLVISGSGSRLTTMNFLGIGQAAVFIEANDGFDFGTPGESTTASLEIFDGAEVESENAAVSGGPGGGSPTGTETSDADVTVSGPGSSWSLESLGLSTGGNASSTLNIWDSGLVTTPWLSVAATSTASATVDIRNEGILEADGIQVAEAAGSTADIVVSDGLIADDPTRSDHRWIFGLAGDVTLRIGNGADVIKESVSGVIVAQLESSSAAISVGTDSLFDGGTMLWLGWDPDTDSAGGTCTVALAQGATMKADTIILGPDCRINGAGTLQGTIDNRGATIGRNISVIP